MTRIEKIVTDNPKAFVDLFYDSIGIKENGELFPCYENAYCVECKYINEDALECANRVREWLLSEVKEDV